MKCFFTCQAADAVQRSKPPALTAALHTCSTSLSNLSATASAALLPPLAEAPPALTALAETAAVEAAPVLASAAVAATAAVPAARANTLADTLLPKAEDDDDERCQGTRSTRSKAHSSNSSATGAGKAKRNAQPSMHP